MTYEEKIQILDNGIILMNTYLSYGSSYNDRLFDYGVGVKREVIDMLKKINAPQYSISSIQNVSFDSCRRDMLGGHMAGEYEMLCANKCNAYKQSVNSIISILEQERTRLIKEQADEEQGKVKQMSKWNLIFSAIAAIGTIATLLFTIFNYLCNN